MFSFEYTIGLNPYERPIIVPSKKTDKELDCAEHKFMGLELARTIIENAIISHEKNPEKRPLPQDEYVRLKNVLSELERICDVFALSIKDQMKLLNDANSLISPQKYDLQVDNIEELHNLNYNGIIYGDLVFRREEGLRVMLLNTKEIFELKGGIDNIHWVNSTGK